MKQSFVYKDVECIVKYRTGIFYGYTVFLPNCETVECATKSDCKAIINIEKQGKQS